MKLLAILVGLIALLTVIGNMSKRDNGSDYKSNLSQEDRRKELAAKVERVMKDDVAMAFAHGTTLNIDSVKCGEHMLDVVADVWRARIKSVGFTEIVCTGRGGAKTTMRVP